MSLKFLPKISRYANLYFFIQNLSEWHASNRKKYNETWRGELSLSTEADSRLEIFRKIHEQYSFGEKYLGRPFFTSDDPWPEVELLVGKGNTVIVKNIFGALEPYFDVIYSKDEPALQEWATIIAKPEFANNASYLNDALSRLYGCSPYDENCTVYLLLSTKDKNGGTAGTINKNAVTLEVSRTPVKLKEHMLNVLWHELIHLYFRNFTLYPLLKENTNNNLEIMGKIDELIASSLLPNGLLARHELVDVTESIESGKFNSRIATDEIVSVQKLVYPYLEQGKTIDAELVKKLCV